MFIGPVAGVITRILGYRVSCFGAGVLMLIGLTAASFVNDVTGLIITYSVIAGNDIYHRFGNYISTHSCVTVHTPQTLLRLLCWNQFAKYNLCPLVLALMALLLVTLMRYFRGVITLKTYMFFKSWSRTFFRTSIELFFR